MPASVLFPWCHEQPGGATVSVDGKAVGQTPMIFTF
ncbi:MAG: PEGA domain-containing protein [Candidatus Aminicenantales bacterium]